MQLLSFVPMYLQPTNEPVPDEPAAAEEITPGQDVANFAQFGKCYNSHYTNELIYYESLVTKQIVYVKKLEGGVKSWLSYTGGRSNGI